MTLLGTFKQLSDKLKRDTMETLFWFFASFSFSLSGSSGSSPSPFLQTSSENGNLILFAFKTWGKIEEEPPQNIKLT